MFEHLPLITETYNLVWENDLPYFTDVLMRSHKGAETLEEAIELACGELGLLDNPWLVTGLKAEDGCLYC